MSQRVKPDTRRFERFRAEQLGLDCEIGGKRGARLRDVSIGGAGVYSNESFEVGSKTILGVDTPAGKYKIIAEIIWTQSNVASARKGLGYAVTLGVRFDRESIEASKDLVFAVLSAA